MTTVPDSSPSPSGTVFSDAALIELRKTKLLMWARKLTRNYDEADDLVNDTIVVLMENYHKFIDIPGSGGLSAWAYRIMRNKFITGKRRSIHHPDTVAAMEYKFKLHNTVHPDEFLPDARKMFTAFIDLAEDQRRALLLSEMEGLSCEEAAAICGVSEGTIKSRISRGRDAMAKKIGEPRVPVDFRGRRT